MARQKVEPNLPRVRRGGVASPVDTYVRPEQSSASQLAEALAEVSPNIGRFSSTLAAKMAEEERAKGERAARAIMEEGKSYADALRENRIDAHASPYYLASLKEQSGRIAADKWEHELTVDVGRSEALKRALDLGEFDKFVLEHRAKWLEKNVGPGRDQHFEKGFGARADAYYLRAREKFANSLASRVRKVSTDQHFAEVKRLTRDSLSHGVSPEVVAKDIEMLIAGVRARGENPKDFLKATMEAVAAAAEEGGDEKWLDVLKHLKDDAGHSFSDLPDGTDIVNRAQTRIWDEQIKRSEYNHKIAERRREQKIDNVLAKAAREMLDNPGIPVDLRKYVAELEGDQRAVERLTQLADAMDEVDVRTDNDTRMALLVEFYEPEDGTPLTYREVIQARAEKRLSDNHFKELLAMIEERNKSRKGGLEEKLKHPFLEEQLRHITPETFSTGLTNFAGGASKDKARDARTALIHDFISNYDSVMALPPGEQLKWFRDHAAISVQEQRRGKTPGILEDEVSPVFVGAAPTDRIVLTEEQMKGVALGNDRALAQLKVFADKYGLSSEEALEWFQKQVELFKAKNGRAPGAPIRPRKQKE